MSFATIYFLTHTKMTRLYKQVYKKHAINNLVSRLLQPGDKLVSLHKVVTSCHKTLHKFEINCFIFFYAVAVVTRYLHVTCMFRTWCVLV